MTATVRLVGLMFYGVGVIANLRARAEERRLIEEVKCALHLLFDVA
jgi:hypothetical protein